MIEMDCDYVKNREEVYEKGGVMESEEEGGVRGVCMECGLFVLEDGGERGLVDEVW